MFPSGNLIFIDHPVTGEWNSDNSGCHHQRNQLCPFSMWNCHDLHPKDITHGHQMLAVT
jgi:hypothetical protein